VLLITAHAQLHSRVWAQCSVVIVMTVIAPGSKFACTLRPVSSRITPQTLVCVQINRVSTVRHWFDNQKRRLNAYSKPAYSIKHIQNEYTQMLTSNLTSLKHIHTYLRSRGGSGSIVSDYGLDDRAIGVRIPAGAKDFSSSLCVQTGSGAHPASCPMGTGGPFPGGKSAAWA
jgi:hypothetical protein